VGSGRQHLTASSRLPHSNQQLMKDKKTATHLPRYKIHGSDAALPLLVYIAGMDGTGELFYKQIPALSEVYRVVTFRLRDTSDATFEDLTDDVATIIGEAGEAKAFIVGESFGGTIAMTFALRYPEMTERLIVINSFPYYRRRLRINLAARLAAVAPYTMAVPFRLCMASLGLWLDGVRSEDRRRVLQALRSVEMKSYARRLRLIAEVDIVDRLAEIGAPTLFIAATRDLLVGSVREAKLMSSRVPDATVKIVEGAGHACLLGNQVRLSQLLAEWIAVGSPLPPA
jgi:pimeloyl-ACP methyl ester carboxylesterase